MNTEIKQVLEKIENNGFEAYIVGGFVRDYLLCHESSDIDIATSALPKDIQTMFGTSKRLGNYGSYNLKTNQFNFDITTYREEYDYCNRNPKKIVYTSNLLTDLHRRDFTMNAICMDKNGKIINMMGGVEDLENRVIRMIGNPKKRLQEDPLRILRAIRFAGTLDFTMDEELKKAILEEKENVRNLTSYRIKKELDAILLSPNFKKCFALLEEFGLQEMIGVYFQDPVYVNDLNGMWAQMILTKEIPFTKNEKKQIEKIKEIVCEKQITKQMIYQESLYTILVAAKILEIEEEKITSIIKEMPIQERKELAISFKELSALTNTSPKETKKIEEKLIAKILEGTLKNDLESIQKEIQKEMK